MFEGNLEEENGEEGKNSSHRDRHLFQLRLLDNGSLAPPTTQVSFAMSEENL